MNAVPVPSSPWGPFEWIVATRFLRDGLMQSLLIVAGVALGVAVIVFMSALLTGLQANLFRRVLSDQAQIVVQPPQEHALLLHALAAAAAASAPAAASAAAAPVASPTVANPPPPSLYASLAQPRAQRLRSVDQWQTLQAALARWPEVVAITPVVTGAGFVRRGQASKAVSLTGIEPESYLGLIALAEKMVAGHARVGSTGLLLGTELAADLGVALGDTVTLQTASGATAALRVSGVFDFGNKGQNERAVYVALRTAQSLLDLPGGATAVYVNGRDPFAAEALAQRIQASTGLLAESWITTNAQFFTAMSAQLLSNTVIRFFVGLTAALGIASVLVVSVVQKSAEIGILRATGTRRQQVLRIFLLQGALVGLLGSLLGSALGWAFLQAWRGLALNADGSPLFAISLPPWLLVQAAAGATLVGTLAAVFPARSAAMLDPAVAIRG